LGVVLRDALRLYVAQLLPLALVYLGTNVLSVSLQSLLGITPEALTGRDALVFAVTWPVWIFVSAGVIRYAAERTAGEPARLFDAFRRVRPRLGRALRASLTLTGVPLALWAALWFTTDWNEPSFLAVLALFGGVLINLAVMVFGGFCVHVAVLAPLTRPPIRTSFRLVATHFGRVAALYALTIGAYIALLVIVFVVRRDEAAAMTQASNGALSFASVFVWPLVALAFARQYLGFPETDAQLGDDTEHGARS